MERTFNYAKVDDPLLALADRTNFSFRYFSFIRSNERKLLLKTRSNSFAKFFFFLPLFKTLLNASSHLLEYTWVAYGLEGNPPCIDFLLGRTHTYARAHRLG